MRTLVALLVAALRCMPALFRSRREQAIVELALRQQLALREAFPDAPHHRYLILDNDAIFSDEVARSIAGFGIDPKGTALRSPWQNGTAERFVGTVRRELLDHVVVLAEDQLRRLLRQHVEYHDAKRVHSSLGNSPEGRAIEQRPDGPATVTALRRAGGLHHRYTWREAA
jgi:transposase InsO family protein